MFIITQNEFFALGVILCLYFKRSLLISIMTDKKIEDKINELIKLIFIIYIAGIASRVYFPLTVAWGEYVNFRPPVIRLDPIYSVWIIFKEGGIRSIIYNLGGNLLLLMPMGAFIYHYFREKVNSIKKVALMVFLISLFIESTQIILSLVFPNVCRYFEINDLILNTIGGVLGYKVAFRVFESLLISKR